MSPVDQDSYSEDGDETDPEEEEEDFAISVVQGIVYRAADIRRVSRMWMHEDGGKKWEAKDYDEVLTALRRL